MIVLVWGLSGTGKSEVAEMIAKHYSIKCIHSSGIMKQVFEKKEIDAEKAEKNIGFYESDQGTTLFEKRLGSKSIDEKVDKKLLEIIEDDNVVMDSWTMPWLSKKGIKILLTADFDVRAERLASRDKLELDEAKKRIQDKEEKSRKIYQDLYGFDVFKELDVFHCKIDTTDSDLQKVFKKCTDCIDKANEKN